MSEVDVRQFKPCLVQVEEGKRYFWCTCGRSKRQPFCDSSHRDTDFLPLVWTADKTEEKLFCACKRTQSQPFCDGSHNNLTDTYAEAGDADGANAVLVDYEQQASGAFKATLDNGCYVVRVRQSAMSTRANLRIYSAITAEDGADKLSQYVFVVQTGESPVIRYPGCDTALFTISGGGIVHIGNRSFRVSAETGVAIKPGEAFRIVNHQHEPILMNVTVCPHGDNVEFADSMPEYFDATVASRVQGVDADRQEAMGDRFFQVLLDHPSHGTPITQFIGEIPRSRAAHHHHIYEETITVLSGEGFMWTDNTKTPVKAGDTIYLPLKQAHSLECTSEGGMRLVGVFYPSMSPSINY